MDFVMKSGAKLSVTRSQFSIAVELKEKFAAAGMLGRSIREDPEIRRMFFVCAKKAIYEGAPINELLFDDRKLGEQALTDYDEMLEKIVEVNLEPFFRLISSKSSTPAPIEA